MMTFLIWPVAGALSEFELELSPPQAVNKLAVKIADANLINLRIVMSFSFDVTLASSALFLLIN